MATRNLRTILKKIYPNGDIDNIFFKTRAKDVVVSDDGTQTLADIAEKVNNSADGATKVEDSSTNGNIKIDGSEVEVYKHPTSGVTAGTYNSVTVDKNGHVTKGTRVTDWTGTVSGNASNATNTFTQATSRANLTSGEKQSTSFGKIMKWFADLGTMAFASNVGTANLDSTLTTFYNAAITTDNVTKSTSITADGWVADARAIAALQTQINTINSNLDGKANTSHGNHVPTTQTANNAVFLRNDNTWQTVTPANIGAATSGHKHAAGDITSGTLGVARGGTGATTFTSGAALIGAGTGAVTTRAITNNTSNANLSGTNLVTANSVNYHGRYWLNRGNRVTDAETHYTTYMARGIALVIAAPSSMTNGICAFVYS